MLSNVGLQSMLDEFLTSDNQSPVSCLWNDSPFSEDLFDTPFDDIVNKDLNKIFCCDDNNENENDILSHRSKSSSSSMSASPLPPKNKASSMQTFVFGARLLSNSSNPSILIHEQDDELESTTCIGSKVGVQPTTNTKVEQNILDDDSPDTKFDLINISNFNADDICKFDADDETNELGDQKPCKKQRIGDQNYFGDSVINWNIFEKESTSGCTSPEQSSPIATQDVVQNNKVADDWPKRKCLVCGDASSGFHYGVSSCEACKAFFKRTVQSGITYSCAAEWTCEIDKRRRKACQACRLQKCIKVGMLREGVRMDRVRGGRQKYRLHSFRTGTGVTEGSFLNRGHHNSTYSRTTQLALKDNKLLQALMVKEPSAVTTSICVEKNSRNTLNSILSTNCFFSSFSAKSLLLSAQRPESPDSTSNIKDNQTKPIAALHSNDAGYEILAKIIEFFHNELIKFIKFAEQIPGFTEFCLIDQMRMLRGSWLEVLTLSVIFESNLSAASLSSNLNCDSYLYFGSNICLDKQMAFNIGLKNYFNLCVKLINRLSPLQIQKEQYVLLKAILVLNSDSFCAEKISAAQEELLDNISHAMYDCNNVTRSDNPIIYTQALMLVLPNLRLSDGILRKFWSVIQDESNISLSRLLLEMLAIKS